MIDRKVLQLRMDEKDECLYHLTLTKMIDGKQAYAIVDEIEKVLSNDKESYDKTVKELLDASIERMQKVEKDAKDELHKAYEDLITNLNNYKFK